MPPATNFSVLEEEDLFKFILSDWLTLRDQIQLDGALCGPKREALHQVMRRVPMVQPYKEQAQVELWWKHHKAVFKWMALRQIHRTTGMWCLHEVIWKVLYNNTDAQYTPILEKMENMRFENFNPGFNLNQLAVCRNLRAMEMYNLGGHEDTPVTEAICPLLEKVFLQGCSLTANVLTAFARCERLTSVEYFHNAYLPFKDFSADQRAAIAPYFERMRSFRVTAAVNTVISTHFPAGPTALKALYLDNVHRNEANTAALLDFVHRCPALTDLTIARCRFNFAAVLKAVREEVRSLERLHLNHCRWLREEGELLQPEPDAINPSSALHTLLISTALPMFDADMDSVLRLCGQSVRTLTVSFCARLKPSAYGIIRSRTPYLRSFELDYSEEDGYFSAEHMNEVQRVFGSLPRLQVNKWEVWLTERMKAGNLHQKTVMLDVTN